MVMPSDVVRLGETCPRPAVPSALNDVPAAPRTPDWLMSLPWLVTSQTITSMESVLRYQLFSHNRQYVPAFIFKYFFFADTYPNTPPIICKHNNKQEALEGGEWVLGLEDKSHEQAASAGEALSTSATDEERDVFPPLPEKIITLEQVF